MKQRIKLAQALMHDPELVLLDEPTNGLDPRGREELLELIRELAGKHGIHVLLSSHLLADVEQVCDQVAVLHRGELVAQERVATLKLLGGRSFELRVRGSRASFTAALERAQLHWRAGRDERLIVFLPDPRSTLDLFELAQQAGVELRHLVPLERTLEDAFAEVLANAEVADA
jgi:ABC-2 type transport system ATP-binding protein